jgi:serine/threonine protein kinase
MSGMVGIASRRYEIVCRLAGGGMADLYLGRTLGPGGFERLVVIKRLAKRLASQASAVQALFDEARIAATLSHANIVQVTDIEITDGQVSIVMEFLHGHDVAHLLRRMNRAGELVPLAQAIAIVLGVCAGLHHAHERVDSEGNSLHIVHRDVSPHNVFITYDGAIKLVDFGIARASVRKGHTQTGFIKGKPGYIAPEQIRGRKTDRRMDVWGAAVLLYELTTGRTPYSAGTSFDELAKVTKHDAPAPSTVVEHYPHELEAIVMRGLARDPTDRFETAEAMRAALEDFARARMLDLSPFRMSALIERVFAENLEAWRQSQRMGRTLAEHVAAFKTSGVHDMIDLPGDPTEPFEQVEATRTLVTSDLVLITAPTQIINPPIANCLPPAPRPRWRKRFAAAVVTPVALVTSLFVWGVLGRTETRATTVDDVPVALPVTVVPIEPEPAPAEPAASEPSIEIETAVAHASPTPARKRPSAKASSKRRAVRSTPPPRAASLPAPRPQQPAEVDLDALLPR